MADETTTTTAPELTPEQKAIQQAEYTRIATREKGEGIAKGKKDRETELLAELGISSLDELKARIKPAEKPIDKKPDVKAGDESAELLARRDAEWKARLDETNAKLDAAEKARQAEIAKYQGKEKRAALVDAAAKAKAIDPGIVAQLCDGGLGFSDGGELVVISDTGVALNDKGNPMTPAEYVAAFLADRPYLVQGSGTAGTGSGPNAGKPAANDLSAQLAQAQKDGRQVDAIALKRKIAEQQSA